MRERSVSREVSLSLMFDIVGVRETQAHTKRHTHVERETQAHTRRERDVSLSLMFDITLVFDR